MNTAVKTKRTLIALFVTCMVLPQALWAQSAIDQSPSAGAMVSDLIVARPIGVVMTVAGTAAFLVSLPFTLLAGSASEAAETLMLGPAETTFLRCLGCKTSGYTNIDIDKHHAKKEKEEASTASK